MKKKFLSLLLIASFAVSPLSAARKEVGKASLESMQAAKRKEWQKWILAGTTLAAIIIAIVFLHQSWEHHDTHGHHHGQQ